MRIRLAVVMFGAALVASGAGAQDATDKGRLHAKTTASTPGIVQDYAPDPAIWLLADEDTRIYLFGTIHVLPAGFRWRSPRLDGILAEVDELILESSDEDAAPEEGAQIAELLGSLAGRPRVSEMLSPGNGRKWLVLGKLTGMAPEEFDRLPPLLALFGVATTLEREQTGAVRDYGVETVLEAEFAAAGKPIGSIESAGEVLASLLAVDERLLIKELDRDLSRWDGMTLAAMFAADPGADADADQVLLADEHLWARGHLVDVRAELLGDTAFSQAIGKLLLDDRNRAWAGWLERRLATPGAVLVAVGAGHLAGENSLQDMLSERGLAAERLD